MVGGFAFTGDKMTFLTLKQAAVESQSSVKTLRRLIKAGRLKAVDFGTGGRADYRVTLDAMVQMLARHAFEAPVRQPRRRRFSSPALESYLPRV